MEKIAERLWERCAHLDPRGGARLAEGEPGGMQKIPLEGSEGNIANAQAAGGSVKGVANNRVLEGGEVHADLVSAPGMELHLDEGGVREMGEGAPVGAGCAWWSCACGAEDRG